jgi:hypothetical protein
VRATSEVDLDALERDLSEKIRELDSRRPGLALDAALGDTKAEAELQRIEQDIAGAQAELQRIVIARGERERRDQVARAEAEAARRSAALDSAADLGRRRQKAARVVDREAARFLNAIAEWTELGLDQERALADAGWPEAAITVRPMGHQIESAFCEAVMRADLPRPEMVSWVPWGVADRRGPLAESDINVDIDAFRQKAAEPIETPDQRHPWLVAYDELQAEGVSAAEAVGRVADRFDADAFDVRKSLAEQGRVAPHLALMREAEVAEAAAVDDADGPEQPTARPPYAEWGRAELRAELNKRGLEIPPEDEAMAALLEACDAGAAAREADGGVGNIDTTTDDEGSV